MKSHGWALTQYDWCPYKKRFGHRHTQRRKTMGSNREKEAVCKPRTDTSQGKKKKEKKNPAETLTPASSLQVLNKFLLLKSPSLCLPEDS